jgi:hypothetical protein
MHRLPLLLVAGCIRVHPDEKDVAHDTAVTSAEDTHDSAVDDTDAGDTHAKETGDSSGAVDDTGPAGDTADPLGCADDEPLEVPVCTLTAPGPVEASTHDALYDLAFGAVFPHQDELGDDPSCPTLTMDGTTEVWTGGCSTADGRSFAGSVRFELEVRGSRSLATWSAFSEAAEDGPFRYAVDGTRGLLWLDEGYISVVDLRISMVGSDDPGVVDGDRTLIGEVSALNQRAYLELYMAVDGADWCVLSDRSYGYWSACGEADGSAVIVGTRVGRYIEQPWPECDGCVCFVPEDAEVELYCR